jgi:hypothetical protein
MNFEVKMTSIECANCGRVESLRCDEKLGAVCCECGEFVAVTFSQTYKGQVIDSAAYRRSEDNVIRPARVVDDEVQSEPGSVEGVSQWKWKRVVDGYVGESPGGILAPITFNSGAYCTMGRFYSSLSEATSFVEKHIQ